MCRYSTPQMVFVKYLRSSRLVNPASCETLFKRTSTRRRTPAFWSRVKNVSADFLVKPIVKIFIRRPSAARPVRLPRSCKRCAIPKFCMRRISHPRESGTGRFQGDRAGASDGRAGQPGFPACHRPECAERLFRERQDAGQPKWFGGIPEALFPRTSSYQKERTAELSGVYLRDAIVCAVISRSPVKPK